MNIDKSLLERAYDSNVEITSRLDIDADLIQETLAIYNDLETETTAFITTIQTVKEEHEKVIGNLKSVLGDKLELLQENSSDLTDVKAKVASELELAYIINEYIEMNRTTPLNISVICKSLKKKYAYKDILTIWDNYANILDTVDENRRFKTDWLKNTKNIVGCNNDKSD